MDEPKEQSERDELGNYLAHEFNVELCEIAAKRGCFRLISQLQFFRWLYSEYDFIKANKSTSILVQNRLKELERTRLMNARDDFQHLFPGYAYGGGDPIKIICILTSLAMLIRNECEVDGELQEKELRSCLLLVEQKLDDLLTSILRRDQYRTRMQIMREVRSIVRKRKFDFSKVENHIKTLPDTKTKLQYLIEIHSDYSQQDLVDDEVSQNFGGKCRVEINKLEKLMALEKSGQGKNEPQVKADGPERDGRALSVRQRALIMHYITSSGNWTKIKRNLNQQGLPWSRL